MHHKFSFAGLMISTSLFAQAPAPAASIATPDTPVETVATFDCPYVWQTLQAASDRGRQLVSVKQWKEAVRLFAEAEANLGNIAAECPDLAASAATLINANSTDLAQANAGLRHQTQCEPALDKAFDADIKVSTARRENRDLTDMENLLAGAENAWQAAVAQCADSYRTRAERSLKSAQKAHSENTEMMSGGPACDGAWKNAVAINDLAKDAKKAKKWDEATMLYDKAHMAWERVTQSCTGSRLQSANQKIEDTALDAYNAEYCGPQWDDANDLLGQLNKAKASGIPFAERDLLMVKTEVLWREASTLCKGDSKSQAKLTADAIARERGAPLPPNAFSLYGKDRRAPVAATLAQAPPPVPVVPVKSAPARVNSPIVQERVTPVATIAKVDSQPVEQIKPEEPGVIMAGDTTYRGNFKLDANSKINGEGSVEWANGDVYSGALVSNLRHGKGRFKWKSGQWYDGEWKDDRFNGKGTILYADGNRYEGNFLNGLAHGQGAMIFASGDRYTGSFEKGQFHGRGTYQWKSGTTYLGDWVLGQKHGNGRMTMPDGSGWEGEYRNDEETENMHRIKSGNLGQKSTS